MEFKLNFSPSPDDERDFIFTSEEEFPEVLDYSEELQAIRNQGSQGSCYAQSACCMKEWQEKRDYGLDEYLSPQFFYNNRFNLYDENPDNDYGMFGRDVMRILKDVGVCLERNYKYGLIQDKKEIAEECYTEALNHRIKGYARVYEKEDLKRSLLKNGPCLIGFPVYNNTPQMWKKRENEQMKGGHAMTVIGYNEEGFIIRNSWGDTWGLNGYCIYPYRDWGSHWEIWTTIDDDSEVLKPVSEEEEDEEEEEAEEEEEEVPIPPTPVPPEYDSETDSEDYDSEDDYLQPTVCPNCCIF
tara:strand:- start:106 stop:999 length:894 start_codon:yes stop_codon:yes gene_type:complete